VFAFVKKHKWLSHFSLPLCFVSFVLLDFSFRYFYGFVGETDLFAWQPLWFTLCWSLLLTALVALLPRLLRRIAMLVLEIFFSVLVLVHAGMYSVFGTFFSFSSIAFAGDGAAFFSWSYIRIRKMLIVCVVFCLLLMVLAVLLAPKYEKGKKWWIFRIAAGVVAIGCAVAIGCIHHTYDLPEDSIYYGSVYGNSVEEVYADFTNTNECLPMTGLYHYTFRNFCVSFGIGLPTLDTLELDAYYRDRAEQISGDNEMTGVFEGKNLIMIMMESIDTFLLQEEYMPNLWALQQESIQFENHYTPLYLSASTFNTEVMTLTGMIPPTYGFNGSSYIRNAFPLALPQLFRSAGYSANTFHPSNPHIYNRGDIHENLGIEAYHNWEDMGMGNYQLDSEMLNSYDQMVSDHPFFTYIITISGHGPYNEEMGVIGDKHYDEAAAAVEQMGVSIDDADNKEQYIRAVSHAMETDAFIGELLDRLEEDGHIDDTVLVLYTDHYGKYFTDTSFVKEMKGVGADNEEDLYKTPFMIYSKDIEPQVVSKYTSSIDIVPTLVNLFDLDADRRYYVGDDIFGDAGGMVMFPDYTWCTADYTVKEAASATDEETLALAADWRKRIDMSMQTMICNYFQNW